ncbi:MAG: methionine--tRNA ligase subunit beta, partial [Methanosarcinales archaeon]|nr:methionine--tRNA ligase subunit beta [Methanosarcinales archaeon]
CPTDVVASGMVKVEDKTFSKSRGYVVWVDDDYLDKGFHPDLLRYYLVSYTSHTKELNFSWKLFGEKINNELVGALGNFMHRTLHLISKNFGVVPDGCLEPEVLNKIESTVADFRRFMHEYEFKQAVDAAVGLSIFGNSYLQANEPWKLMKTDEKAAGRILKNALQISKALTIMLEAVMPESMARAWEQLGMQEDLDVVGFDDATVEIKSGQTVNKPEILFTKLDDAVIANMEETLNERIKIAIAKESEEDAKSGTPEVDAGKGKNKEGDKAMTDTEKADDTKADMEYVTFDDFGKMDIRIGKIVSAENIPKSKKLLKIMVDLGEDKPRQIVAGIANDYEPESLVGKLVSVLSNMKPAKLMGVESNGMIMAADTGKAILLKPDIEVDAGTPVH